MKKKIVSLVLAFMLCLSCVSALAAEAWTVTCPWAPSGVAAMVNQKAASLSTTYSQDYVLVANAEKGDTATINSWLTKYTEADPQMCFIGEGMFGITAILDPERMNFTYDDFEYVENLYSSIFVASARKELGLTSIDALKAYLEEGNQIMVGTNGATGSEAFLAAALIGAMGYGDQFYLIPYESAAEAAQAVARGEVDIAVSHQSQILETWQQGGVDVFAAFDGEPIAQGPFKGVEGVACNDRIGVLPDLAEVVTRECLEIEALVDKFRFTFTQSVDAVLRVVAVHDGDIVAFHVVQVAGGKCRDSGFADATFLCCECNEDFITHGSIAFNG